MISIKKFWAGVLISTLLLVLFLITVDLGRMVDALVDANYVFIIPAVGMYLISILFRTFRWQVMLRHLRPIKVSRLYPVVVVGYMANNILPMRLGELVRSYCVSERENVSKTSALATIFLERVLDALTLLFFISVIAIFVPLSGVAEAFSDRWGISWLLIVSIFIVPFVVAFCALLFFALFPQGSKSFVMLLFNFLPQRFKDQLSGILDMFIEGLVPMRNPRMLGMLWLLSVPIWIFESGLFFLVGFAFDLNVVFVNLGEMFVGSILVTAIANIGSSIPAAPGGIGLFEIITRETLVFSPLGSVDRSVAGAFAAVSHAALIIPMIILGQIFLWSGHLSLRRIARAEEVSQTLQKSVSLPSKKSGSNIVSDEKDNFE